MSFSQEQPTSTIPPTPKQYTPVANGDTAIGSCSLWGMVPIYGHNGYSFTHIISKFMYVLKHTSIYSGCGWNVTPDWQKIWHTHALAHTHTLSLPTPHPPPHTCIQIQCTKCTTWRAASQSGRRCTVYNTPLHTCIKSTSQEHHLTAIPRDNAHAEEVLASVCAFVSSHIKSVSVVTVTPGQKWECEP